MAEKKGKVEEVEEVEEVAEVEEVDKVEEVEDAMVRVELFKTNLWLKMKGIITPGTLITFSIYLFTKGSENTEILLAHITVSNCPASHLLNTPF